MRIILYTGKGGVGKSTIAAATAVRVAEMGRRTLLVSSDLAHNLSDIFATPIGGELTQLTDNLTALEVDILQEVRSNWRPIQEYLADFLAYLGTEDVIAEEMALFPGLDDFFLLTRILREFESGRYDTVIVDCSPTAGTLGHLTLSDAAGTKLNKLIGIERRVLKLIRPLTKASKDLKAIVPEDKVYGLFEDIISKVGRLGEILKNPEISSARLVLNPDRIAIAETQSTFTYFGLFGFPIDGIVVNKVLPNTLSEGYLHDWYTLQGQLLDQIDQSFLDVAQLRVPLSDQEPIGLEPLSVLGRGIFSEQNPDGILSDPKLFSLTRVDGKHQLTFRLLHVEQSDIDVGRRDGELILTADNYTRVFTLPDSLADREIADAKFRDGSLSITFE